MQKHFKKFIEKIRLTDAQVDDARTKYNHVCSELHSEYYPNIKYDGSTKFLIGSYGKADNIRPPGDVDVLFKMPENEFERYDNYTGNGQSQLLQDIRAILKDEFTTTEKIKAFGKVVVIEFADGTHNIELLPAWQLGDRRYRIPNTENGGSWDIWDPAADIQHIQKSNTETGCTLDLIRMIKRWKDYKSIPLKSFKIELIVVDFLSKNAQEKEHYALTVKNFFESLVSYANQSLVNPSGEIVELHDDWVSKAEKTAKLAEDALALESEGLVKDAVNVWKETFGPDFPMLDANKILSKDERDWIGGLAQTYPSSTEVFLDRDYNIPFVIDGRYLTNLDADVTQDGFRKGALSTFIEKRFPLKKHKKLLFKVKTTVPLPFEVKWKVRNFGDEARDVSGLRGEISDDKGLLQKDERTLYKGVHYVECYIVKENKCISVGRVFVPIEVNTI